MAWVREPTERLALRAAQRVEAKVDDGSWYDRRAGRTTFRRFVEDSWWPSRHLEVSTRTSVRLMLAAGIPVRVVASVHGHDPRITRRIYAHTRRDDAIAAMATLDRLTGRGAAIDPLGL